MHRDDPLARLRALVMERQPVQVRWRLGPGGLVGKRAEGVLAWQGADLILTTQTGTQVPIPLGAIALIRAADTGRVLWSPRSTGRRT